MARGELLLLRETDFKLRTLVENCPECVAVSHYRTIEDHAIFPFYCG